MRGLHEPCSHADLPSRGEGKRVHAAGSNGNDGLASQGPLHQRGLLALRVVLTHLMMQH